MRNLKYFDNAATTKVLPAVKSVITQALEMYGNPSATNYNIGLENRVLLEKVRQHILEYIGADKDDYLIFTSSASEANTQILNSFPFYLTSQIEHKSMYLGNKYGTVGMDDNGEIDLEDLEYAIHCTNCKLVSIQGCNNELGNVQPIKDISNIVHKYNGIYHCDATQLVPYVRVNVKKLGIDAMTFSGHKIGCPKGIGCLYISKKLIGYIKPLINGSQENGLRGGTENLPYILGLNEAINNLEENIDANRSYMFDCYRYTTNKLRDIADIEIHNENMITTGAVVSVGFKDVSADILVAELNERGFAVSSGSACNTNSIEPSYVLESIGVDKDYIYNTIRISFSVDTDIKDMDELVDNIKEIVECNRRFKQLLKEEYNI